MNDEQFIQRVSGITNNASRRDEVFRQMFTRACNSIQGEFEIRHNLKTPGSSGSE
jgi:hypothetical protein